MKLDLQKHKNAAYALIVMKGKDVEYWQGNYGTAFCNESVRVFTTSGSSRTKSLANKLKYRRLYMDLPFGTNFNNGMGKECYFEGIPKAIQANNAADYDLTPTYILQHKSLKKDQCAFLFPDKQLVNKASARVNSSKAYNGYSSYAISWRTTTAKDVLVHKLFKTELLLKGDDVFICSAVWGNNIADAVFYWIFKLSTGQFVKEKADYNNGPNGWKIMNLQLQCLKQAFVEKAKVKGIYIGIVIPRENIQCEVSLGQFGMYEKKMHWIEDTKKLQIEKISFDSFINAKTAKVGKDCAAVDLQLEWNIDPTLVPLISCVKVYM